MAYCYVKMPRAGLGNRLLIWARAKVLAKQYDLKFVEPIWPQVPLRNILKFGKERRDYLGIFKRGDAEVPVMLSPWLWATTKKVSEENVSADLGDRTMVVVEGLKNYYEPLNDHVEFLKEELFAICRQSVLDRAFNGEPPIISMHVRRGDFTVVTDPVEFKKRGGVQTPLQWFVDSLRAVRKEIGKEAPALISTDGSPKDLELLLKEGNIEIFDEPNPLTSILRLSRGRVLIGSGGSSFSGWISFLGRMPTVVIPGQCLSWMKLTLPESFLGVFDPENPNQDFLRLSRKGFESAA